MIALIVKVMVHTDLKRVLMENKDNFITDPYWKSICSEIRRLYKMGNVAGAYCKCISMHYKSLP